MAFWGVYLKPNEPYTVHPHENTLSNRLRITQATLGEATRISPARSIVRCSVGDKPAIAICSLSVKELTCCQLELEFEESHDVVFSVMGPRGVYLAGYVVSPSPPAHQHSIDCDLHKEELDSSKHGLLGRVKESIDALKTGIEQSDKVVKGGNCLLKCSGNKNIEGNIITLDQKSGKDDNIGPNNDDQEKPTLVKTQPMLGRIIEKKSKLGVEKKKMKRNRKRKRNQSTPKATANEHAEAIWSSCDHQGSHENLEKRKKPSKRSKDRSGKKSKIKLMKMMRM